MTRKPKSQEKEIISLAGHSDTENSQTVTVATRMLRSNRPEQQQLAVVAGVVVAVEEGVVSSTRSLGCHEIK